MSNESGKNGKESEDWKDPKAALDPFSNAILREKLKNPKITNQALAKLFMANNKTIANRIKTPAFQHALKEALADLNKGTVQMLKELVPKAIKTLDRNMESGSGQVEVAAAKAGLDYTVGRKQVIEGGDKPVQIALSPEEKAKMAKKVLGDRRK